MQLMEKERKSIHHTMRVWHRYAGFFIVGFTVIYALSGITLIYRDTDLLKSEKQMTITLAPGLKPSDLAPLLRMREVKVLETKGDVVYFEGGSYNSTTGEAVNTMKDLVFPFNKFARLHKTASKDIMHWFTLIFGISMGFLAISSLWMFKAGTRVFRNGMITVLAGVILAVALLWLIK
jgi:hypothetical protein